MKALDECDAGIRVVDPDQLHVTYKFLGEAEKERVPTILDALRSTAFPPPFEVDVVDVGAFPDWNRMNVLWAGLDDEDALLAQVARAVEDSMAAMGWARENRKFRGHVTLARRKTRKGMDRVRQVLEGNRGKRFGSFEVSEIRLLRSILRPTGSAYETVGRVAL